MMTVFPYGNNQKDPLFRQASQVFYIVLHIGSGTWKNSELPPRLGLKKRVGFNSTEKR